MIPGPAYAAVEYGLYDSIVVRNTDSDGSAEDIRGSVSPASAYNLVGNDRTNILTAANHNLLNVTEPGLGPLADNGGPTRTMALLPGSPAIDAGPNAAVDANGNPLLTDQRGLPRLVNGAVDIGAFRGPAGADHHDRHRLSGHFGLRAECHVHRGRHAAIRWPGSRRLHSVPDRRQQFRQPGAPGQRQRDQSGDQLALGRQPRHHGGLHQHTADFLPGSGSTSLSVQAATVSNIQSVVTGAPSSSGGTVTLQASSSDSVTTALQALSVATPATPVAVTLDLAGSSVMPTAPINDGSTVQLTLSSSLPGATISGLTISGGTVVIDASVAPSYVIVNGGNVIVAGSVSAGDFIVNGGTVTLSDGTVITGNSPAIIVNSGTVILQGVTAQTATISPTIVVNGGSLTIRESTIQESTGYAQAAILVNGGTVDLGHGHEPWRQYIQPQRHRHTDANTTAGSVPAVGDTFENNGAAIAASFGVVTLSAPAAQTANQGVPQPFSLGSLTDTVNDSQSWAVDVNWGDGSAIRDFSATTTGPLNTQSHAFALPGTYTVTITATDPLVSGVLAWDLVQTFTVTVAPSVLILDPTAGGALTLSGNASINIPGAIVVDSSSSSALSASGNAAVNASAIDVHGGVQKSGNASVQPRAGHRERRPLPTRSPRCRRQARRA